MDRISIFIAKSPLDCLLVYHVLSNGGINNEMFFQNIRKEGFEIVLACFWGYHVYLASINETTNERFKYETMNRICANRVPLKAKEMVKLTTIFQSQI